MSTHTVDSEIMLAVVERLKGLVNGIMIRYEATNKVMVEVFAVSGSFTSPERLSISAVVVTDGAEVKFTYQDGTEQTHDFSASSDYVLVNSGYTLTVNDLATLYSGDKFYIDCNDTSLTVPDVRTWKLGYTDSVHPFLQVFPGEFIKSNKITVDRRKVDAVFDLQLEVDFSSIDSDDVASVILDACGDITDLIQEDPRFKDTLGNCRAIDSEVTSIAPYVSSANDNLAGAFLQLAVKYRTSLKNSRTIQP